MINQIIRAARLDRSFYTGLLFDDYAMGNAVALVALITAIPVLVFTFSIVGTGFAAISGLLQAGLVALAAWAVGTRMFRRDGRIPATFRLTAFAHATLIPTMITPLLPRGLITIVILGCLAWFYFAMRVVADVQFDLTGQDVAVLAGLATLARFVVFFLPI